jgi:hypothetical protein
LKSFNEDYRIHILIRKRGNPVADSTEIKTEHYLDDEDITEEMERFTLGAIRELDEGDDNDSAN